jgi:hypothetical protein
VKNHPGTNFRTQFYHSFQQIRTYCQLQNSLHHTRATTPTRLCMLSQLFETVWGRITPFPPPAYDLDYYASMFIFHLLPFLVWPRSINSKPGLCSTRNGAALGPRTSPARQGIRDIATNTASVPLLRFSFQYRNCNCTAVDCSAMFSDLMFGQRTAETQPFERTMHNLQLCP